MSPAVYPFQGQFFDRGGLRLHYLDEGVGDPVVMVHGNPTWSLYFRSLVTALRPGYRVIVPDHIGLGLSDKPGDDRYRYRLESRVDDLAALLEHLGIVRNVTLVMHDWGAMIGMGYAHRHPDRIARLVVMNGAAFHLPRGMRVPLVMRLARDTPLGPLAVRGFNAFARVSTRLGTRRRPLSREVREAYCAPYDSWANRIATVRFVQDVPLSPGDPSYALVSGIEEGLEQFRNTPALFCWAERDFVFPLKVLDHWRSYWPQAEVLRLPGCGHYVLEDAPEEIGQAIQTFLTAHPLPHEQASGR
ncbi:MAG: alpha/beta fold hydrolase [Myxococcota bacterium]|nr:alpha/beta fold hydrolase [Myxococcota bacterium]